MKMNDMFLFKDYRGLYESSCGCLKMAIINALGEIFVLTGLDTFAVDKVNGIKIGNKEIIGVSIKDGLINIIIVGDSSTDFVVICDEQENETFKTFDSDINNWISFIELMQKELKNGIV